VKLWQILPPIAAATLCLLLWMIAAPVPSDQRWTQQADSALNDYALADRALQRDLLTARAGLWRNYDCLTQDSDAIRTASLTFLHLAQGHARLLGTARALALDSEQRENLTEEFKSTNALLQNSLARLASASMAPSSREAANALAGPILHLTLDTGPDAVAAARSGVAHFKRSRLARNIEGKQLTSHAELLIRLLPAADGILTRVQAMRVDTDLQAARMRVDASEARAVRRHHRAQWALVLAIAATLVVIILFGVDLYRNLRSLRRRGEYEHLHATILALLIDVRSRELPRRIERALERLADHVGGDHAYLLLSNGHATSYLWSRARSFSADDARSSVRAATNRQDWENDHIVLRGFDGSAAIGSAVERTSGATPSIVLVRSPVTEGAVVLGFEAERTMLRIRPDTISGLSAALAAILQAIHRDRLETERLDVERQLQRGRRMETVGAMASGIAHNFNNIIGAIAGFTEMAELHLPPCSPAMESLSEIRLAVIRARTLVERVLSFGRRADGKRERIGIDELVDETIGLLRASIGKGFGIEVSTDHQCPLIEADTAQIQQVLMNLCNNAALAMPAGGTIRFLLERRRISSPRRLSHATLSAGDYVVVSICDSGRGISPAALPRLFEPFFTTREAGTGLGLSTAWEVVQDHGGSIDVRTEPGRGSQFAVWLPIGPADHSGQTTGLPTRGSGETILLINEDQDRLEDDEEMLAALGYEPLGASLLAEGLDLKVADAVLLIDYSLGPSRQNGRWASAVSGNLPVIIASAHLRDNGPRDVIAYPLRPQELAHALATILRKADSPSVSDASSKAALVGVRPSAQRSGSVTGRQWSS